jgi:hypothetical protein
MNIIGNFQDSLNTLSGSKRKFVFNRGEFDAKRGLWNIDLLEIIETAEEPVSGFDYLCTSEGDRILTSGGDRIIVNI